MGTEEAHRARCSGTEDGRARPQGREIAIGLPVPRGPEAPGRRTAFQKHNPFGSITGVNLDLIWSRRDGDHPIAARRLVSGGSEGARARRGRQALTVHAQVQAWKAVEKIAALAARRATGGTIA
jgi:hypothetical protein